MGIRRLGYPCVRMGADRQTVKRCQLRNATPKRLRELIDRNLDCLLEVLEYNVRNSVQFFRIHSDTIPFASHPEVDFNWYEFAESELRDIGSYVEDHDLRISMHPGQYTVLNSPDEDVVENAVGNLQYHARLLDGLGLSASAKIVVHIGGVYDNRESAMDRFVDRANSLPERVRDRLVIENDETSYDVRQVLALSDRTDLPVIFDWLHHRLNEPEDDRGIDEWVDRCTDTWGEDDGVPILHFSTPSGGGSGHHADRIDAGDFERFLEQTRDLEPFDVMLECKDKEVALEKLREELGKSGDLVP